MNLSRKVGLKRITELCSLGGVLRMFSKNTIRQAVVREYDKALDLPSGT